VRGVDPERSWHDVHEDIREAGYGYWHVLAGDTHRYVLRPDQRRAAKALAR
jgi:hypothetical protein